MKKKTIAWMVSLSLIFLAIGYGIGRLPDDQSTDEAVDEREIVEKEETEENTNDTNSVNQSLTDWMPPLDNVVYHYEGIGNEYAEFKWTPQFNKEDYYQISRDNSGTVMAEVYEYREDEIVRIFSRPETYFRENFTEVDAITEYKENEIVLKKPIDTGTSWTSNGLAYEITAVDKEIEVPAGSYQTIEVTVKTEDSVIKRYYAENIGLVYESFESEGLDVESKLENIQTDTAEEIPITIYQADDQMMGLEPISAEIQLDTNEPARLALQELFRGEKEGHDDIFLLPEGTEINYLFLNDEEIVEVDLSSEYISNMNTGSSGETFYLTALGNTLTRYYGVENVLLTIDGENYEGSHIVLSDNEYLSYNEEMVNQ